MRSHLGLSPYGGKLLRVLVGLHLVLPSPGGQVEWSHHRHHLLEARGSQRHGDGWGRGQSQAHGPSSHCYRLLDVGELYRTPLSDNRVQSWHFFFHKLLSIIEFCLSQGFQQSLPWEANRNLCSIHNSTFIFPLFKLWKWIKEMVIPQFLQHSCTLSETLHCRCSEQKQL